MSLHQGTIYVEYTGRPILVIIHIYRHTHTQIFAIIILYTFYYIKWRQFKTIYKHKYQIPNITVSQYHSVSFCLWTCDDLYYDICGSSFFWDHDRCLVLLKPVLVEDVTLFILSLNIKLLPYSPSLVYTFYILLLSIFY